MASIVCPFCEKHSHMAPKWSNTVRIKSHTHYQAAATCDNCGRAVLGVALEVYSGGVSYEYQRMDKTPSANFTWYPRHGTAPKFHDVPEHIARAAKEAHSSDSVNNSMAAILMARTVVEATAKEKGITKGNLVAKIDEMANQSFIRSSTKDASQEIRHFGNDMAHGDIQDVPGAEDVRDVLILMDEILAEVFQGPARTARLLQRRTANP